MFGLKLIHETMLMQDPDDGLPPTQGGSGDIPAEVYQRYISGQATEEDLVLLVQANEITPAQAQAYDPVPEDSLAGDLANTLPISTDESGAPYIDEGYYVKSPNVLPNASRFLDQALVHDFAEFHRARAVLRAVSRKANLSILRKATGT